MKIENQDLHGGNLYSSEKIQKDTDNKVVNTHFNTS